MYSDLNRQEKIDHAQEIVHMNMANHGDPEKTTLYLKALTGELSEEHYRMATGG